MSDIPSKVTASGLWRILSKNAELAHSISKLRESVEVLASKISEQIPEFTDHSIKHLDALWAVADKVLTPSEMERLSTGEAFVLAGSLYLHDLGMAVAATVDGADQLRKSKVYSSTKIRLQHAGVADGQAEIIALKHAARSLHAKFAFELAVNQVPGLNRYLIEDSDIRSNWAEFIGQVAESHHWSIQEVERVIGSRNNIPDPVGGKIDLGYVASLLRIVDYAHINMDRAPPLEKLLRPNLPADSLMHWAAQENITGPQREGNQLVFGATKAIISVDGWWTIFEMARGLDIEISAVNEYLSSRTISSGRFSLEGVKGAKTPQNFATLVPPKDFEPVDIRFRPDSMERLVGILGGRTLYGNDRFAPIREILQNARDAIALHRAKLASETRLADMPEIRISLEMRNTDGYLTVSDNGIGMSTHVLTNYLLGIATDYWNSPDYYSEHASVAKAGFRPVGRFGIGFLSVFMLGDLVRVQTEREGGQKLVLVLQGIGQRGTLQKLPSTGSRGTSISVRIPSREVTLLNELSAIVLAKAPMLEFPVTVVDRGHTTPINPAWWKSISQSDLSQFVSDQPSRAILPLADSRRAISIDEIRYRYSGKRSLDAVAAIDKWPDPQPEIVTDACRLLATPELGGIVICSKGFAVSMASTRGISGLVEIGDADLNVARSQVLAFDLETNKKRWLDELKPQMIAALNRISAERDVPARYNFLVNVARMYGLDLLIETTLPWITVREAPGNAILIPVVELKRRAESAGDILIGYGVSPWNVESGARECFPSASENSIILPVSMASQPEPGSYDDEDVLIEGSLAEHFESKRSYEGDRDPEEATLLMATLNVIATSWGASKEDLPVTWVRKKRKLYGKISRLTTK